MGQAQRAARFSHHTYVLIVGTTTYRGKDLQDLPACSTEAEALEAALTDQAGCAIPAANVIRLPDDRVTAAAITEALRTLTTGRTVDDTLIVYLAGHGAVANGEFVYLTGAADEAAGLTASALDDLLASARLRGILLLADCCGGADLVSHAPSFFRAPPSEEFRLFVSASRAGQSSWELATDGKSLFTDCLLAVLRGETPLRADGGIYYLELYEYLHTAVQTKAEHLLGDRLAQEPVALGSHGGDPLLFLHRDLSLSQVRVKTQRITREYMRRKVIGAVGSITAIGVLSLGGYWALLDGHQYLQSESTVRLTHGYPGLTGFGLPIDDWTFRFGPEAILPSHPLSDSTTVLPRAANVGDYLSDALRPGSRALLKTWQNKSEEAIEILLSSDEGWGADGIEASRRLSFAVSSDQANRLERLISALPDADAVAAVLALSSQDPERAITAFRSSPVGGNAGHELNLLASWTAQCTPAVQAWLDSYADRAGWVPVATVALTAVVATCAFPTELLYSDLRETRDSITALRYTNATATSELTQQVRDALIAFANATSSEPERRERFDPAFVVFLLSAAVELGTPPCLPELLEAIREDDFGDSVGVARLLATPVVVLGCDGYEAAIEMDEARNALHVSLSGPNGRSTAAYHALLEPLAEGLLELIDTMISVDAQGVAPAIEETLARKPDGLLRAALIERLATLDYRGVDPVDWRLPSQPMLDRAIAQLLAKHDSQRASTWLREILQQPSGATIETLALVEMTDEDREAVLKRAESIDPELRTIATTLAGETDAVVRLLTDKRPDIRMWAAQYVALRSDWDLIRARAIARTPYPDGAVAYATEIRAELNQLSNLVLNAPPWSQGWLIQKLQHHRAQNAAAQLHLTRMRIQLGTLP